MTNINFNAAIEITSTTLPKAVAKDCAKRLKEDDGQLWAVICQDGLYVAVPMNSDYDVDIEELCDLTKGEAEVFVRFCHTLGYRGAVCHFQDFVDKQRSAKAEADRKEKERILSEIAAEEERIEAERKANEIVTDDDLALLDDKLAEVNDGLATADADIEALLKQIADEEARIEAERKAAEEERQRKLAENRRLKAERIKAIEDAKAEAIKKAEMKKALLEKLAALRQQ